MGNMTPLQRYNDTHLMWAKVNLPNVVKDGHYCKPLQPDLQKTGGITDYCINTIHWLGVGRVKRVNVVTRASDKITTEASGNKFTDKRYTKSIKKGTADIIGSLRGKAINIEIKNKYTNDKFKEGSAQDKDMKQALKAGEIYWIVTCVEDFLYYLDSFLYGQ